MIEGGGQLGNNISLPFGELRHFRNIFLFLLQLIGGLKAQSKRECFFQADGNRPFTKRWLKINRREMGMQNDY